MYPALLGKFIVSETDPDWILKIKYQPEPPIVIRGALNPWADERQREIYLAEEKSWKAIPPHQAEYRKLQANIDRLILLIQQGIQEIESITGKKSGLGDKANYAVLAYSISGGPYAWAASIAKMGIDLVLGFFSAKKKKKKIAAITRRLEGYVAEVNALQAKQKVIQGKVAKLIQVAEGIRQTQSVRITEAAAQSETAYVKKREVDTLRANVLRERIRQVATLPRRAGGYNEL